MKKPTRTTAIIGAAAILMGIGAGAAQASSFGWSMTGVLTGFNSRTYSSPSSGSHQIESDSCSWSYPGAGGSYYRLQLTQETPWYEPDRNAGQYSYPCPGGYGYHDFGSQPGGSYHFTYVSGDNSYGLNSSGYVFYP